LKRYYLKLTLEDAIDTFVPSERSYKLKYVNMANPNNLPPEQIEPKLEDVILHYNDEILEANNVDKPIAEGFKEEGYIKTFKYAYWVDMFNPCANQTDVPDRNCFNLNIKNINADGVMVLVHEKLCINGSFDGVEEYNLVSSGLVAGQFVNMLNTQNMK